MVPNPLIKLWKKDEQAPFTGWDFSYLNGRWKQELPSWDYFWMAKNLLSRANDVLDMATGGGEFFSSLAPFPASVFAIEGYRPNVPIAEKRLSPLGVRVLYAPETQPLPFQNGSFDLVLNRHGGTNPPEICRILAKGGTFLTQQVAGETLFDLMALFGAKPKWPENNLEKVSAEFKKAGFEILESKKWTGRVHFLDVGAVVYFLKAIPWLVDGFNVDKHRAGLEKLQEQIESDGILSFSESRFLIMAQKRG
jgi:hypothetical protein